MTGVNTNTLVIPDVRSSDDNTYTCVAINDGGSVTSDPAKLAITGRIIKYCMVATCYYRCFGNAGLPEVIVDPPSQSVEVRRPVQFTTSVRGVGKENFSYQWRHNREDINGQTSITLTIVSVTKDHGGSYECVVKNEYGDCVISNASMLGKYDLSILIYDRPAAILFPCPEEFAKFLYSECPHKVKLNCCSIYALIIKIHLYTVHSIQYHSL